MRQFHSEAKVHGEKKSERVNVLMTPTGLSIFDALADRCGVSRGEFLERAVRWIDAKFDGQLERDLSQK